MIGAVCVRPVDGPGGERRRGRQRRSNIHTALKQLTAERINPHNRRFHAGDRESFDRFDKNDRHLRAAQLRFISS